MIHNTRTDANSQNGNGTGKVTTSDGVTSNIATRQSKGNNGFGGVNTEKLMAGPDRLSPSRSETPSNGSDTTKKDFFDTSKFNPFRFRDMLMSETGFRYETVDGDVFIFKGLEQEAKYINTLGYKPVPVGIPGATALRIGLFYENPESGKLERIGYRDTLIYANKDGRRIAVGSFSLPLEANVTPLDSSSPKELVAHMEPENIRIIQNDAIWVDPRFRNGSGFKGVGQMLFEINVFLLQSMSVDELQVKRVFAINFHERMGAKPSLPILMPQGASFGDKGLEHPNFEPKTSPHNELYRAIKVLSRRRFAAAYNSWESENGHVGERIIITRVADMYPEIAGFDGSKQMYGEWREYLSARGFDYSDYGRNAITFLNSLPQEDRQEFTSFLFARNKFVHEYGIEFARRKADLSDMHAGNPENRMLERGSIVSNLQAMSDIDAVYDLSGLIIPRGAVTRHNGVASDIFVPYRSVDSEVTDPNGGFIRSLFHNFPIEGYF